MHGHTIIVSQIISNDSGCDLVVNMGRRLRRVGSGYCGRHERLQEGDLLPLRGVLGCGRGQLLVELDYVLLQLLDLLLLSLGRGGGGCPVKYTSSHGGVMVEWAHQHTHTACHGMSQRLSCGYNTQKWTLHTKHIQVRYTHAYTQTHTHTHTYISYTHVHTYMHTCISHTHT